LLLIGWDWASTSHAVTVLDATGAIVGCWTVGHTEHDLEMLLARLAAYDDPAALPVAIERAEAWSLTGSSPPDTRSSRSTLARSMPPGPAGALPAPSPTPATATSWPTTCAPTATGCAGSSRWTRPPVSCNR
jgi:hypothetical protein